MANLRDRVKAATATAGTGTITLGAAVAGYRSFAAAYAADRLVSYVIEDGTAWETGVGTYSTANNTLTRSLDASSSGALLNLSGNATVGVTLLSRDFVGDWPVLVVGRNEGDNGSFQPLSNGNGFTTLQLNSVSIDTHAGWDAANYQWVVPQTGLYDLQGTIRPVDTDNNVPAYNFIVGVDVANQDSAGSRWQVFPSGSQNNTNRFSGYASRLMMLTAGQRLRLFTYIDRSSAIAINKAELVATRIR